MTWKFKPNEKGLAEIPHLPGLPRPLEAIAAKGAKIAKTKVSDKGMRKKISSGRAEHRADGFVATFGNADIAAHLVEFGGGHNAPKRPITKAAQELGGASFHIGKD